MKNTWHGNATDHNDVIHAEKQAMDETLAL